MVNFGRRLPRLPGQNCTPVYTSRRIQALVVDNLPGMRRLAHQRQWVLQLCQFHLLLKLRAQRRGVRYALRGGVREEIQQLVRSALQLPDGPHLTRTLKRLARLSQGDCGPQHIQTTVREFLSQLDHYRCYRTYPHLGLPWTTNAVESMGRILRELFRSSRAGSNPASVLLWATALIRIRPKVTCNGYPFNRTS